MKLFYINVGSVKNKYIYLNDYIHTHDFDIVAICETWLGISDHDDTCVNGLLPDGYAIYRADRTDGRRGGGVALIYKQCLDIKCNKTVKYAQFEYLLCSIVVNNSSISIVVVYRPPPSQENQLNTNTFLNEWDEFLSDFSTTTNEVVIVGDLNIHLDNLTHHHTITMKRTLECFGLQQHVHQSTHYCGHTLDVLISRDTSTLVSNCTVKDIGLCDDDGTLINGHYAVICDIQQRRKAVKSKSISYRKMNNINIEHFRNDIRESTTLNNITGSVDELMERYLTGMTTLVDIHAPLLHRVITPRPNAPWYTNRAGDAKRLRRSYERKWRHSKSEVDRLLYRRQCAVVAKELNCTKRTYLSAKVIQCANNSKELHKITEKLLVNQHQQTLPSDEDHSHLANRFGAFFESKIDNIRQHFNLNVDSSEQILPNIELSEMRPATIEEVRKLITSYSNKSCELDPVPTWLLKKCLHELLPLLTALINKSLTTGIFPKECKNAIIRPMLKKSTLDPEVLKNYRPLSNLHFVSKILEKIVGQGLEEHLNRYSLHDPLQSAYRKGHSTETAILKISNDINVSLDQSGCVVLASLDLSAAFDTVDHDIFLHRLQSTYGISGIFYCWFKSYLENRKLRVCVHFSHSETQKLKCGVPQGSVLGARMYAMYAHPMSNIVNKHDISYHNYADDTQLYIACDNNKASVIQAVKSLEDCITDISEWMGCNSLKINEDKTEFVIFSRNPDKYSDITLQIGTDNIKSSDYVKILGVTLDSSMNMQKDIANTCRTTYMHIRKIRSIRCYLNEPATKSLVNATVISRLDYCNSLYIGLPLKSLYKHQLALNTAARLISGTHRHSHITPVLQQLN